MSLSAASLVCGLIAGTFASGLTPPTPSHAGAPARKPALNAEGAASLRARTTGKPVEVASLLSETTRVVANPDGTFTAEVHSGPARYRNAAGAWKTVDLTLQRRADGAVAPKGHPRGLILSGAAGAGDHDLARLSSGASRLTLGWTGMLPAPQLHGTSATYREVRPGLDVVVDATRTGFEQYLVVKNRAAAAQLKTLTMPWRTDGLVPSSSRDGGLILRDRKGAYVGHVPPAVMWDATIGAKSGDPLHRAPVAMAVRAAGKARLALSPKQDFLNDPATKYPVTIDPSPTLKPGFDTFVQDNISSDQSTSKQLKLGFVDDEGPFMARSFIRWPTSALAGKRVTAATMYLWNKHSWNCDPHEWQVWITDPVGTSTSWDRQPKWYGDRPIAKSSMTKGYAGCTAGYITANVKPQFDWAADHRLTTLTTGLRGKQSDEENHNSHSWKKFDSSEAAKDPFVSITYNTKPSAPRDLHIGGKDCGSGDPRAYVSKTPNYPAAQARASDPDGTERNLSVQFFVGDTRDPAPTTPTMSKSATSGSTATIAIPRSFGLAENVAYTMYAKTFDGLDYSPSSAACTFTIDSTGPAVPPTVKSWDYAECTANDCSAGGGIGASSLFQFDRNGVTDVTHYRYWFDGGPKVTIVAPNGTRAHSVKTFVDPPPLEDVARLGELRRGGPRTLHVVSVDAAGRESGEYAAGTGDGSEGGFHMLVGPAPDPTGWWKFDDEASIGVVEDSSPNNRDLTLSGAVTSVSGNGDGGRALSFALNGVARGPLSVGLHGSRTTTATVQVKSFNGKDATIVRHFSNVDGGWDGVRKDELYVEAATKKICYRSQVEQMAIFDGSARPDWGQWKVCSSQMITPGMWIRIAGGFDAMKQEASVYVSAVRTASVTSVRYIPEPSLDSGTYTVVGDGTLVGAVDDVRTWDRILQPEEVGALGSAEAGRWDLDQNGDDTSTHPLHHTVTNATSVDDVWNDFGHVEGDTGSGWLDGTSAFSTDAGGVLRTDQSFSVSAWASLSDLPTGNRTVLSQDGAAQSNFYLGVRMIAGSPRWSFSMSDSDAAPIKLANANGATAIVDDDTGGWVHLVGVYDASAQQTRLYVDGKLAATVPRTARWQANGPLNIGRALYTTAGGAARPVDFFTGSIDAVRVYAGVLTSDMVNRLYQTQDGQL